MDVAILEKIIQLFEIRIGLNPDNMNLHAWKKLIQKRMQALNITDLAGYYHSLWTSETEFKELLELVVVPETWFFRDKAAFEFICYFVTHLWLKKENRSSRLNILCIPCSTGEEAVSTAITLHRSGLPKDLYTIDAWDISEHNIEKAKEGIFNSRSFRDKDILKQNEIYFDKFDHQYKVKDSIMENIFFAKMNALKMEVRKKYDIVLCRNLLIYLSPRSQKKLLENIKEAMGEEGILIVSPVETQLVRNFGLPSLSFKEFLVFLKHSTQTPFVKAKEDVKSTLPPYPESEDLLKKAISLADHEKFEEAKKICADLLKKENVNSEAYFLLGVLNHATEHFEESEAFFKKAIYLQPDHYDALIYLALLEEKKGNFQEAQLYRNRAMRIFQFKE